MLSFYGVRTKVQQLPIGFCFPARINCKERLPLTSVFNLHWYIIENSPSGTFWYPERRNFLFHLWGYTHLFWLYFLFLMHHFSKNFVSATDNQVFFSQSPSLSLTFSFSTSCFTVTAVIPSLVISHVHIPIQSKHSS